MDCLLFCPDCKYLHQSWLNESTQFTILVLLTFTELLHTCGCSPELDLQFMPLSSNSLNSGGAWKRHLLGYWNVPLPLYFSFKLSVLNCLFKFCNVGIIFFKKEKNFGKKNFSWFFFSVIACSLKPIQLQSGWKGCTAPADRALFTFSRPANSRSFWKHSGFGHFDWYRHSPTLGIESRLPATSGKEPVSEDCHVSCSPSPTATAQLSRYGNHNWPLLPLPSMGSSPVSPAGARQWGRLPRGSPGASRHTRGGDSLLLQLGSGTAVAKNLCLSAKNEPTSECHFPWFPLFCRDFSDSLCFFPMPQQWILLTKIPLIEGRGKVIYLHLGSVQTLVMVQYGTVW